MNIGNESAGGTGKEGGGDHGAKAIEKIANDIYENLKKQLGDHPNLNKAAIIAAINAKIAPLAEGSKPIPGTGPKSGGTAKTTAVVHVGKTTAQNFENDTATASGGADVTLTGFLVRAKQSQRDEDRGKSASFIIEGSDLPDGVDEADTCTIDGENWNISDVEPLPVKAGYIIRLRK
jgi:hypothetical protein